MRLTPSSIVTLSLGCFALIHAMGCSHLTRPSAQHALLDESIVVDALDHTAEQGNMLLTEEGLWALIDPKVITPEQGGLLLLTQPERPDASPQLFAIVSTHDWGAMLQRLSRTSFTPTESYVLAPIKPEALSIATHGARYCPTKADCTTFPYQYLAYALQSKTLRLETPYGPREDRYTLPLKPAWGGVQGPHLQIDTRIGEAHGFIASVETRCAKDIATKLALPASVHIVSHAPVDALDTHPRFVEQLAATQHADVIISCPAPDRIQIATPSLARPWLPARNVEIGTPGPALLGAVPLVFDTTKTTPARVGLIAQGAGFVARGFFARAGVLFEHALEEDTFSTQRDDYAMTLAQIIALDAPEQAARIAYQATRQAWRRDEVIAQNMVMIAAWSSLGQRTPVHNIESSLPERTSRQSESILAGWATWRGLVQGIKLREFRTLAEIKSAARSFPQSEESTPSWNLMLGLSLLLSETPPHGENLTELESALVMQSKALDAQPLLGHYINAAEQVWGCDDIPADQLCLLDVSGKRLQAVLKRPEQLEALLSVPTRPPYLVARGNWRASPQALAHDPLTDMVMAFIRARDPIRTSEQLAAYYGGAIHQEHPFERDQIQRVKQHITHRDRPDLSHIDTLNVLLDGLGIWINAPKGVPAHELFKTHLGRVKASQRGTLYTFWHHALLTDTSHPQLRARIKALAQNLPTEAPASMCTGTHSAHALSFLEDNRTSEAQKAFGEVKRCNLDELDEEARLDVETVRALIARQDKGSLPGDLSTEFTQAMARLDPATRTECQVAWLEEPRIELLLSDLTRALAIRFAPVQDASLADNSTMSVVPLNATSKRALAIREMQHTHELLIKGKTSEAMTQLEGTLALARAARAWHLVRQIEFAREVLAQHVRADEPGGGNVWEMMEASLASKDPLSAPLTLAQRTRIALALAFLSEDEPTQHTRFEALKEPDMTSPLMKTLCEP